MQNVVFLFCLKIFVVILASKPRSVNVALETVLEFDSKDDIDFIDTMQNFLKKLKTTIRKNRAETDEAVKPTENNNEDDKKPSTFTDLLGKTITVLKSYKDEDLKTFFSILGREFKSWQKKKDFHEVADQLGFRRLIDRNLQSLKNAPVFEIRRKLNTLSNSLNLEERNGNKHFVSNFLNYFYKKESEANLLNLLNNLKLYRSGTRRNNITDLKRIIRNGILTIMEPLLKLKSNTILNINAIYYKLIANNSQARHEENLPKHMKHKNSKTRQNNQHRSVLNENEILDYIEDHKRVIDNHLTNTDFVIKTKENSRPKILKITGTTNEYIYTTRSWRNRSLKTKEGNIGRVKIRPRETKKLKHLKPKILKIGDASDNNGREPVLIKVESNDDSELKSVEKYIFTTSKRQKRYKKTTRRKMTTRKPMFDLKTTKKFRKAFRTTTLSAEGLSIEHFGSLFGREFHRKNNDNDTFVHTVLNSNVPTVPNYVVNRNKSDGMSKEIRRNNNVSKENEDYNQEIYTKSRNASESIEENTKDTEIADEKYDGVKESIKIKGNIIIEKPTEVSTHNEKDITTSKPVNDSTTNRIFNISIITKYFNVTSTEPTIVLRGQNMGTSNEAGVITLRPLAVLQTNITPAQATNIKVNESQINTKTTDDGLENEIEDTMVKHNVTIPVAFENFFKNVQVNVNENKNVQNEMQADLAKLLAPPTTKSTVTELFTDPFNDIDDGADIL